jgi:hypothetical protein
MVFALRDGAVDHRIAGRRRFCGNGRRSRPRPRGLAAGRNACAARRRARTRAASKPRLQRSLASAAPARRGAVWRAIALHAAAASR